MMEYFLYSHVVVVANLAPIADAGSPQTVPELTIIELDGSGSSDPEGSTLHIHGLKLQVPV